MVLLTYVVRGSHEGPHKPTQGKYCASSVKVVRFPLWKVTSRNQPPKNEYGIILGTLRFGESG